MAHIVREIGFDKGTVAVHGVIHALAACLSGIGVSIKPQTFRLNGLAQADNVVLKRGAKVFD
ncbi:hypothetical protein [Xenorhabdus bovienii]|uniref:hypothetical protein n=1 Tax=Xenorhabdus bovienii TaxID=40576 RepID=UPI001E4247E5|nr:hypothetical protein [Xenorhabdus bovienii]